MVTRTCSWRGGPERRSPESGLCFQRGGWRNADRAMRCQSRGADRWLVHTRKNGAGAGRLNWPSRRDEMSLPVGSSSRTPNRCGFGEPSLLPAASETILCRKYQPVSRGRSLKPVGDRGIERCPPEACSPIAIRESSGCQWAVLLGTDAIINRPNAGPGMAVIPVGRNTHALRKTGGPAQDLRRSCDAI